MYLKQAYDRFDDFSVETGLDCSIVIEGEELVRTKQEFKDESDINVIVKRFGITGSLPEGVHMPLSADFKNVGDFHSAMNEVRKAVEAFMAMPADIRSRFGHSAENFVAFCDNQENWQEAAKLGLIRPELVEAERKRLEEEQKELAAARAARAAVKPPANTPVT